MYCEPAPAAAVLRWAAEAFPLAAIITYDPMRPTDPFGQQMLANLEARGVPLRSIGAAPDQAAHVARLLSAGWGRAEAVDMDNAYRTLLDTADRRRIERLEFLDELEEFRLLLQHYVLALGVNERFAAAAAAAELPAEQTAAIEAPSATDKAATDPSAESMEGLVCGAEGAMAAAAVSAESPGEEAQRQQLRRKSASRAEQQQSAGAGTTGVGAAQHELGWQLRDPWSGVGRGGGSGGGGGGRAPLAGVAGAPSASEEARAAEQRSSKRRSLESPVKSSGIRPQPGNPLESDSRPMDISVPHSPVFAASHGSPGRLGSAGVAGGGGWHGLASPSAWPAAASGATAAAAATAAGAHAADAPAAPRASTLREGLSELTLRRLRHLQPPPSSGGGATGQDAAAGGCSGGGGTTAGPTGILARAALSPAGENVVAKAGAGPRPAVADDFDRR